MRKIRRLLWPWFYRRVWFGWHPNCSRVVQDQIDRTGRAHFPSGIYNKKSGTPPWGPAVSFTGESTESTAILDGEGEKCPTCGGTDREGGTVATSGPDEFGNYDTDDCPDLWHEAKATERKPGPLHG